MDVCLRLLKESNKGRFYSYSVRNGVLIIELHIFSNNLSRNSCIILGRILLSKKYRAEISDDDKAFLKLHKYRNTRVKFCKRVLS